MDMDSKAKKIQVLEYPEQGFSTQNISVLEQHFSAQNTFDKRKYTKKTTKKTTQTKKQAPTKHIKQPLQKTVATIKPVFEKNSEILTLYRRHLEKECTSFWENKVFGKMIKLQQLQQQKIFRLFEENFKEMINDSCVSWYIMITSSDSYRRHQNISKLNKESDAESDAESEQESDDIWEHDLESLFQHYDEHWESLLGSPESYKIFEKISWEELDEKIREEIEGNFSPYWDGGYDEFPGGLDECVNYYKKLWYEAHWTTVSSNPNAIHYLKKHLDKVNWEELSKNTNAHVLINDILKLDTKKMQENIAHLRQELISYVWNPDRISRMASILNVSFQEYLQCLGQ